MRALKIIALPSIASPKYTSYYRHIGSIDLSIITKATRAAEAAGATGAAGATNNLSIPIKLGFSSLLFLIDTSTFLKYLD